MAPSNELKNCTETHGFASVAAITPLLSTPHTARHASLSDMIETRCLPSTQQCNEIRRALATASPGHSSGLSQLEKAVFQATTSTNSSALVVPQLHNVRDSTDGNWRIPGDEIRRLRSQIIMQIESLLRNHQPHNVLTHIPENLDWHSKVLMLAIKLERLMFTTAKSRESYLDESTLRQRMQRLSSHLVQLRKRKHSVPSSKASVASEPRTLRQD